MSRILSGLAAFQGQPNAGSEVSTAFAVVGIAAAILAGIFFLARRKTGTIDVEQEAQRAVMATMKRTPPVSDAQPAETIYLEPQRDIRPVRVAMGPIIGAILIAQLITGLVGVLAYELLK